MVRFFFYNRFMWLIYAWLFVCATMIFNNPYINVIIFAFGMPYVVMAFCYIQDGCKLNKEEQKFLLLCQKMFE